jgi:hypothetical protein
MGTEGDTMRSKEPSVELKERWWLDPDKAFNQGLPRDYFPARRASPLVRFKTQPGLASSQGRAARSSTPCTAPAPSSWFWTGGVGGPWMGAATPHTHLSPPTVQHLRPLHHNTPPSPSPVQHPRPLHHTTPPSHPLSSTHARFPTTRPRRGSRAEWAALQAPTAVYSAPQHSSGRGP